MKKLLLASAAVSLMAGAAVAGPAHGPATGVIARHQLNDKQMDSVAAGQVLGVDCPGCTIATVTGPFPNLNGTIIPVPQVKITVAPNVQLSSRPSG